MSVHSLTDEVVNFQSCIYSIFFCSCSVLLNLQLEQILLHKWACHCVWMGFAPRSNGRATPCGRFSQLPSRESNSWAPYPPRGGWICWGATGDTDWVLLEMWKWKSSCSVAGWRADPHPWPCGDTNSHMKRKLGATEGRALFLFLTSPFSSQSLSAEGHISRGKLQDLPQSQPCREGFCSFCKALRSISDQSQL